MQVGLALEVDESSPALEVATWPVGDSGLCSIIWFRKNRMVYRNPTSTIYRDFPLRWCLR